MQAKWDRADETHKPTMEELNAYVNNPLWQQLCRYLEDQYQIAPVFDFSKCSMQRGWNVKYKKAGRALCTLYPMEGYFIAMIVIGEREREETEAALPLFTEYFRQLYRDTETCMGNQKWLMIKVTDDAVLKDVKRCVVIRRGNKKK